MALKREGEWGAGRLREEGAASLRPGGFPAAAPRPAEHLQATAGREERRDRQSFVRARVLATDPAAFLGAALHRNPGGTVRGLCLVDRLAAALQAGDLRCDPVAIGWLPAAEAVGAYLSRWGRRTGFEGAVHRRLRGAALPFLAALVPGRLVVPEGGGWHGGHRRPDLLVSGPARLVVAAEVGATDSDSVYAQLASRSASHVVVLPAAGLFGPKVQGYCFRRADAASLPPFSPVELLDAWLGLTVLMGHRSGGGRAHGAVRGPRPPGGGAP